MRLIFTLTSLLAFTLQAPAQKITGIWRGYFSSSNGVYREGVREEMYKYEIQINQLSNNGIQGVTYSYKSTVFYGKAKIQGIYNVKSNTLLLKETELTDLKVGDKSEPCLMTCYLDYTKVGKLEVLQGTFISTNIKDKGDCGSGKVYLERVPVSDFKKEDFLKTPKDSPAITVKPLLKAKPSNKDSVTGKSATANKATAGKSAVINKTTATNKATVPNKTVVPNVLAPNLLSNNKTTLEKQPLPKPTTKPLVKGVPKKPEVKAPPVNQIQDQPRVLEQSVIAAKPIEEPIPQKNNPIPKVLLERENNLVRTIITDEENVQIDLFDNGTIDNDTISVFNNNVQLVKRGRLAYNPIRFKIKNSLTDPTHELVVVAENLGEIPPNTALMVITAGKKRYEIFLSSNEERNAKVVIQYVPKN
jgi:hypothetical protein